MTAADPRALWFGLNIDPGANNLALAGELAAYADASGADLIGIQDHPYNPAHLDTWTLLSALGARTKRVRLLTNVLNLPLRPPAMLAKAAATLDLITGGRVELGLGAGALWDQVAGYGGPRRSAGEAVAALEEAIQIMRRLWGAEGTVEFAGAYYQLPGAKPGPLPTRQLPIWLGALKPRMLELTGRLADGWSISHNWVPPEQVPAMRATLDAAADEAGRPRSAIRRNYNLMGHIEVAGQPAVRVRQGMIGGDAAAWAELITRYATELGMDCFIYWPVAGDAREQARLWAEEVLPAARQRLGVGRT
jgi:alkanesulfonate monooxygenase SsuD/methylene tetrahydromethanopterin reductase-like flavin-dependent oxidoreductase (luciferase family)